MYITGQVGTGRDARIEKAVGVMAYRYQVTSVGLWRGKIKRWNTTFHAADQYQYIGIYNRMQSSGWKDAADVVGACSGGVASIRVYASTGGAPVIVQTYFDWQTPSTWIPYTGTYWAAVDPATPLDAAGESAIVVVGNMAGLSSTGKPVTTRKYLHAVPSRTALAYGDPDVGAATIAAFQSGWTAPYLANPAGVQPSSVTIEEWYGNHQRVRGRRRTTAAVAAQAFSFGVLAGGGATTSGQGTPFPGGEF